MTNEAGKRVVNIELLPTLNIVYMRRTGAYGPENNALMQCFKAWVKDNGLFSDDCVVLGIALDDPTSTPPKECRYDTCLIVKNDFEYDDRLVLKGKLDHGIYAVLKIPHTAEAVAKAWSDGFSEVVVRGFSLDPTRPIIERYKKALVDKGFCEICVPIT